jgi:hypothetical protein
VPRSASLLLEAIGRRPWGAEDRLTELLASVCESDPEFGQALLAEAGLMCDGEVEATTQLTIASGRVDMQLLGYNKDGSRVRLWSEHKTGSGYGHEQLIRYHTELVERFGEDRSALVTIVPHYDEAAEAEALNVTALTWQDIGRMAWELGKRRGGTSWSEAASHPQAAACQRILCELLSYLQERHQVTVEPLSHMDLVALAEVPDMYAGITELLERTGDFSKHDPKVKGAGEAEDFACFWKTFDLPGFWAVEAQGYGEVLVSSSDDWTDDRLGNPAVGSGFTLPKDLYDDLRSSSRNEWHEQLRAAGFTLGIYGDWARCFRTLSFAEVIASGSILDAQARYLATWADETFEVGQALNPGPLGRASP